MKLLLSVLLALVTCHAACVDVLGADGNLVTVCGVTTESTADSVENGLATDINVFWILICGILVFFMQAGFSMLESGCVAEKNVINILFKNLMDAGIGAIAFWLFGYAFAYGRAEGDNVFIGETNFALSEMVEGEYHNFFFQWAFAATAATIVSGAVAERCKLSAYFAYSFIITAFIYPVVVHWVWDTEGWLSAFGTEYLLTGDSARSNGMIDFAGSGVVHMVGGFSALTGAIACGPRLGRFAPATDAEGRAVQPREHNQLIATLGVIILWVGWYGFNCGSTLAMAGGASSLAAKVAVTTTLAAASGCISCMLFFRFSGNKEYSLLKSLNGVLAGLVSITAGCATVEPWAAFVIGILGAAVYISSSALLARFKIDDPLDASPIHGFCGFWGVLAVGIFSTDKNIAVAYHPDYETEALASGAQFAVQLVAALAIFAWTTISSGVMFFLISKTIGIRVTSMQEIVGMDLSEHGGAAYSAQQTGNEEAVPLKQISQATPTEEVAIKVEEAQA